MQELLDKRAKLIKDWRSLLDKHKDGFTSEAKAMSEKMEKDIDALDEKIKAERKQRELEAKLDEPMGEPIFGSKAKEDEVKTLYKSAFESYIRGEATSDFKAALSEGVGADGGYLVPQEYQRNILERMTQLSRTRAISTVIPTKSTRNIPIGGELPQFSWVDENGAYGEATTTFGQVQLSAWKLGGIMKVSEELIKDSAIDLQSYLVGLIARGLAQGEDAAFAVGDGVKKPTGYSTKDADITLSTSTGVTADEVIDIFYTLKVPYRANATWRMNDGVEKIIRKLKDANNNYIYAPAMNVGERDTLLGRPIEEDPNLPLPASDAKIITLGDFSYYYIADRGEMELQKLVELYAGNGQVGIKANKRVDGKITVSEAFVVAQSAS